MRFPSWNPSRSVSPVSLIIFHRHGDRSPLRGHSPDEDLLVAPEDNGYPSRAAGVRDENKAVVAASEEYWSKRLVPRDEVVRLDKRYPIRRDPDEADPIDEASNEGVSESENKQTNE